MPRGLARSLFREPREHAPRVLAEQRLQSEPALARARRRAERARRTREVVARDDESAARGREERGDEFFARGRARVRQGRGFAQVQRQAFGPPARARLFGERRQQKPRPTPVERRRDFRHAVEVDGEPAQHVLPKESLARRSPTRAALVPFGVFRLRRR